MNGSPITGRDEAAIALLEALTGLTVRGMGVKSADLHMEAGKPVTIAVTYFVTDVATRMAVERVIEFELKPTPLPGEAAA